MTDSILLHEHDERGVHTLTLAQPNAFNALSSAMLAALGRAVDMVAADEQARVLVLAAQGRAFCAGHDLKELNTEVGQLPDEARYRALFATCSRLMMTLRQLPVPVIARVQGLATAAGCQLVAQSDLAVAAQSARFGVNGIDLGLFCATPSVALSRNMLPKQAMHMLLTGEFIDAQEAMARGLVNQVVPDEALDGALEDMVASLLCKPRRALAMGKALFYRQLECGMEAAYQLAGASMACNLALDEAQEGVRSFVEKRAPRW